MAELLRIRNGSFQAEIFLDKLPELQLTKTRKLFQLMLSAPEENQIAIMETPLALLAQTTQAHREWGLASMEYSRGWRKVLNKKARDKATLEALTLNRHLTANLREAKARFDRWIKIKSIFEGELKE